MVPRQQRHGATDYRAIATRLRAQLAATIGLHGYSATGPRATKLHGYMVIVIMVGWLIDWATWPHLQGYMATWATAQLSRKMVYMATALHGYGLHGYMGPVWHVRMVRTDGHCSCSSTDERMDKVVVAAHCTGYKVQHGYMATWLHGATSTAPQGYGLQGYSHKATCAISSNNWSAGLQLHGYMVTWLL